MVGCPVLTPAPLRFSSSPQCVVVGTERGDVYVVTPGNYSVVHSFVVPAGVVQIGTQGSFQVIGLQSLARNGTVHDILYFHALVAG